MRTILLLAALTAIAGCRYATVGGAASAGLSEAGNILLAQRPSVVEPKNAVILHQNGNLALVAGETKSDAAANELERKEQPAYIRNSLFLKQTSPNGTVQWQLLLTTGSDWREADGMDKWQSERAKDLKNCFYVHKASFASNGRYIWLVCDPYTFTYKVVCSYDVNNRALRVLIDGDTADEQPDGTILARNKKTYLSNDKGLPLGARWYDVWIAPDGKIVRKGRLKMAEEVD